LSEELTYIEFDQEYLEVLLKNMNNVFTSGRKVLEPIPNITLGEYAEKYIVLPDTVADKSGPWSNEYAPHVPGILEPLRENKVHEITIMGSSQIAKTSALIIAIGYCIEFQPGPMQIMQPTEQDARDFSKDKLSPVIQSSTSLRKKVKASKKAGNDSSTFRVMFPGGYLLISTSNSPSATRQRSMRRTFADDIDGFPVGTPEGDVVTRLEKRTTTFSDYLNWRSSTPTRERESRIHEYYKKSSMGEWHVRCEDCDHEFQFEPENLVWEKDMDAFGKITQHYPETAFYACPNCGVVINESKRKSMLRAGRWVHKHPERISHQGFFIGEISSVLSSFERVASEIIKAGDDEEKIEALTNTVFGKPYKKSYVQDLDPLELFDKVEDYIDVDNPLIPNQILVVGVFTDVQEHWLESLVLGMDEDERIYVLWSQKFEGNLNNDYVWDQHEIFIKQSWKRKDGIELNPSIVFIDTGYRAESVVYPRIRGRHVENIYGIKGSRNYSDPILPRRHSLVDKGRTRLLILGVNNGKHELFNRLKLPKGSKKSIIFCKAFCDAEFIEQVVSEEAIKKKSGMIEYVVYQKKKKNARNEKLDLLNYGLAGFMYRSPFLKNIKIQIDKIIAERKKKEEDIKIYGIQQKKKKKKLKRSGTYKVMDF